ncbi:MAG: hypothetical protein HQL42_12970 [Alphaproteobacteria bacterium]|nr:hypothetical protein [Alphaproteobacteria bacterium]
MASDKQIDIITTLATQKGFDSARAAAVEYGFSATFSWDYDVTSQDLSDLIDWLNAYSAPAAAAPTSDVDQALVGRHCLVDGQEAVILSVGTDADFGYTFVEVELIDECRDIQVKLDRAVLI